MLREAEQEGGRLLWSGPPQTVCGPGWRIAEAARREAAEVLAGRYEDHAMDEDHAGIFAFVE